MLKIGKMLGIFYFLSIVWGLVPVHAQETTTKDRVMLILDGSNSMWGQIDGVAKISIAKQVMSDLISNWDKNTDLGLMSYGHRRKSDCKDIEIIYPVGSVNRAQMLKKVKAISPRGKTPISDSILKGALALQHFQRRSSIVLVSDGLETCEKDPCLVAKTLKKTGVDFTIHVVGFDVTKIEERELSCIAGATGGKFFRANNAAELKDALQKTTHAIAKPQVKPIPKKEPKPGFFLYAKLCDTCDRLKPLDVLWDVRKKGAAHYKGLGVLYASDPKFEPGSYQVSARYASSALVRNTEITVDESGQQIGVVNLNGGGISLYAFAGDDKALAPNQVLYKFFPVNEGVVSKTALDVAIHGGNTTWLPAGAYNVVATHQSLTETAEIEIIAGKVIEYTFDMRFGYFQPTANLVPGGKPIRNFTYRVFASKEAAEKGGTGIAFGTSRVSTKLALKSGDYWVETIYSPSNVTQVKRVFPIAVTAKVLSTPVLSMDAGIVNFDVSGGSLEPFSFLVWIKKVNDDGSDGPVMGKTTHRKDSAALVPGRYRFFEFYSKKQTDDFEVVAGQTTALKLAIR